MTDINLNGCDTQIIYIKEMDDFQKLLLNYSVFGLRKDRAILQLSGFTAEENQKFGELVNVYYRACGCSEGTLAGMVGVVFIVAIYFVNGWPWNYYSIQQGIVYTVIVLFLSMSIGKVFGLLQAKHKLKRLIQELSTKI